MGGRTVNKGLDNLILLKCENVMIYIEIVLFSTLDEHLKIDENLVIVNGEELK